ncbi:MAG: hypothetical protein PHO91_01625 [Patescibacteria group bacterium]|nr:hypothetical protein [Patescibacteria group bacterium]
MKFEPFFNNKSAQDKNYIFNRDEKEREYFRIFIENLWKKYYPYADDNFLIETRNQFHQRLWEMYLACIFLDQKIKIYSKSNSGPDIKFEIEDSIAWCETTTASRGNDAVDEMYVAEDLSEIQCQDLPEEQMIIRITNAIDIKYNIFINKYLNQQVKDNEPFIIAINRYETQHIDPGFPLILSAVFAVGHQQINLKTKESGYSLRPKIKKKNGIEIDTTYFCNNSHKEISAIIYCTDHLINLVNEKLGKRVVLVHNPFAKNPLPKNVFNFESEYVLENNHIKKI